MPASAWPVNNNPVPLQGFLQGLQQGMQMGQGLQQNRRDAQMGKLQQALLQTQAKYADPMAQAQLQQAQAEASAPFGGKTLPGIAGDVQGLEMLKQYYGDNSPQYQQASQLLANQQNSDMARVAYENALTSSLPQRYLSPTGKLTVEQSNIAAGQSPAGIPFQNSPVYSTNDMVDTYNLALQKGTTDTDTRKRNLFATNIEKTIDQINPDALTQYGGLQGKLELYGNQGKAALNIPTSKEYQEYQKSLTAAQILAHQIGQFYGTSIQPEMVERLENLANPSSWTTNPQLSKEKFQELKQILNNEIGTYRSALKSRSAYQEPAQNLPLTDNQINALKGASNPGNANGLTYNPKTGEFE